MKAAVINELGETPQYRNFSEPEIQNDNQILMDVKMAAVKNLDKIRASGAHYASHKKLPAVVGMDGIGILENGKRVYAQGITGMLAEKAIIHKNKFVEIPDHLDLHTAAALPNAVLGAAMAIKMRGEIKKGQTVLINGATGVTGQMAVQIAKYYGAKTIIATGRNSKNLKKTEDLGADQTLSLRENESSLIKAIRRIHHENPIDLVIDYLWGKPIETIINALKGEGLESFSHQTKIVTVGSMAGENINLSSGVLRSSAIQILGSGFGSLSKENLDAYHREILPEMFQLAADGKLKMDLVRGQLVNIENLWKQNIDSGKRLVISIQ